MAETSATCWTLIRAAAHGAPEDRDRFARYYGPVVKAYLLARWKASGMIGDVDDALQDVFMECFKEGGALERARPHRAGGFRAFLYGVTRNVTLRREERRVRAREETLPSEPGLVGGAEVREEALENVFDRAWARATVRQAVERQEEAASTAGEEAKRRVALLRLRFQEGLPIREIAKRWDMDAARLHHDYARARREFEVALREIVAFHLPGEDVDLDTECRSLLQLLQS